MLLTRGLTSDFDSVCALYARVTSAMHEKGIAQWNWGTYPNADQIHKSIDAGTLYVVREGNTVVAAVTLDSTFEPAYDAVNWLFGGKPGTFHRLCIAPEKQRQGLGRGMMGEMLAILRSQGCTALRCDTLVNNSAAITLYQKIGMRIAGHIRYSSLPDLRFAALEMRLTNDCPLLPLKMHPAFRGGKLTPWGGEKLRTVYGKDIREVPTGESLEVSCIPGLESTDDAGVKLPDLIAAYGEAFAGEYAKKPFPLLLKLIDAAEPLSVQVHPNDDYAARVENGKLGKTEAWLILDAPEGSQLVYGIKPGTTLDTLRAACEQGAAVEPLLRRVTVHPGDVCFIPAGCVHAIGAGIMLYEIQQSSDITYRFYDWDRVDKNGNRRELHLQKALDVTDLTFSLDPIPAPNKPVAGRSGAARRDGVRAFDGARRRLDRAFCGRSANPAQGRKRIHPAHCARADAARQGTCRAVHAAVNENPEVKHEEILLPSAKEYHRRNAGGDSLGRRLPVLAAGRKYAAERAGVGRSSAVGRSHPPDDAGLQQHHPREVGRNADFHHADPPADDSDPLPPRKAPKTAADADAALPALDRIVLLLRQSRRRNECLGRSDRIVGFGAV